MNSIESPKTEKKGRDEEKETFFHNINKSYELKRSRRHQTRGDLEEKTPEKKNEF
jgi:hypothetical protein